MDDLDRGMPLAEAIRLCPKETRLDLRRQAKCFRLLHNWFSGGPEIGYYRFKELSRGYGPEPKPAESLFLSRLESYLSSLGDAWSSDSDGPKGDRTVFETVSGVAATADHTDPIASLTGQAAALLRAGLWPPRYGQGDEEAAADASRGDVEALWGAFSRSMPYSPCASRRPVSRAEVLAFLKDEMRSEPLAAVFLCGSFLDGDYGKESDVDVEVAFREGLSRGDKVEAIQRIQERSVERLQRVTDVFEIIVVDGEFYHAHPRFREVTAEWNG